MLTWKANHSSTPVQVVLIISELNDAPGVWEASLQQKGYTTIHEPYEHALQTCKVVHPDLIVIDTNLSSTDQLALCATLRTNSAEPILLLVPDYDENHLMEIYNVGVSECLLKPVSPAFLVVKVVSWLLLKRWFSYRPELYQAQITH